MADIYKEDIMKHILENEQLRVVIEDHGAELNSII